MVFIPAAPPPHFGGDWRGYLGPGRTPHTPQVCWDPMGLSPIWCWCSPGQELGPPPCDWDPTHGTGTPPLWHWDPLRGWGLPLSMGLGPPPWEWGDLPWDWDTPLALGHTTCDTRTPPAMGLGSPHGIAPPPLTPQKYQCFHRKPPQTPGSSLPPLPSPPPKPWGEHSETNLL